MKLPNYIWAVETAGTTRRQRRTTQEPHARGRATGPLHPQSASWPPPYELYIEVAEALNRLAPGDHPKRTALFNTGAEAVENAVKYARAATKRPAVVFDHAFHGRSLLTMTMTGKSKPYKHGFGPFAPEVYRAPMAYPYRWPSGPEHCAHEAMTQFAQLIDAQIGADMVAAVVVEPIQGEAVSSFRRRVPARGRQLLP